MVSSRLVYCHGLPGSPGELAAFAPRDVADRAIALSRLDGAASGYHEATLMAFDTATAGLDEQFVVIGFSLGAMAALRIATARPERISRLVLASPAAPLELGDFLPLMAGRPVFEAAVRGDFVLRILSAVQSLALTVNWRGLLEAMFRNASPAELAFVNQPAVQAAIRNALRRCLGPLQSTYRRELIAYVQPWATHVRAIACPVEIWQGSVDTWTPPSMANALRELIGASATLKQCEGLGHYSTLAAALGAFTPRANP